MTRWCHDAAMVTLYTHPPPIRHPTDCFPTPNRYRFDTRISQYADSMAPMKQTTLRLSPTQFAQLEKLSDKLGLTQAGVIRFAISRLVEEEKIVVARKR